MTIALLATGDEIIHGDTLNTNSVFFAKALSSEGIPLGLHLSCSDKEKDLIACLNFLKQAHDTIIITGGLGPTSDDRTRYALAKVIQQPLKEHPQALEHLKKRLLPGQAMQLNNLQQALFPDGAHLLPNPYGSAVGCYGFWEGILFILLPGPPRECIPMFEHYILPLLQKKQHSTKHLLKWMIFGLAESEIAHTLDHALADLDCQTGYRLDIPYIEFKARCKPEIIDEVKKRIEPLVQDHIICPPDKKASKLLKEKIIERNVSLSIVDEVTGGRLQGLIHCPATHGLLHFCENKASELTFYLSGLNDYWSQAPRGGQSAVSIRYKTTHHDGVDSTHFIYRSEHIVHQATEWLCFRLSHFIDELH